MIEFLAPMLGLGFFLGLLVLFGATTVLWLYTIVDAIQRDFDGENDKVLWVLVILFAGFIGSIIYYFVVMSDDS